MQGFWMVKFTPISLRVQQLSHWRLSLTATFISYHIMSREIQGFISPLQGTDKTPYFPRHDVITHLSSQMFSLNHNKTTRIESTCVYICVMPCWHQLIVLTSVQHTLLKACWCTNFSLCFVTEAWRGDMTFVAMVAGVHEFYTPALSQIVSIFSLQDQHFGI